MGVVGESIGDPHAPDAVLVESHCDFVFCNRELSHGVKLELTEKICRKYGVPMPEKFDNETTLERFLNTTCHNFDGERGEYLSTLVHRASTGAIEI